MGYRFETLLLAAALLVAAGSCGGNTPRPACEVSADKRTESCTFREGDFIKIKETSDFDQFCETNCRRAADTYIGRVEGLEDLSALSGIVYFNGLTLLDNSSLKSLEGLDAVGSVRDLVIRSNDKLESLEQLSNLKNLEGGPKIAAATTIRLLEPLGEVEKVGSIHILGNNRLKKVSGIGGIEPTQNMALIKINGNDILRTIQGFNQVEDIPGLRISNNKNLRRIEGFQNLEQLGYLHAHDNPNLPRCELERLIEQVEAQSPNVEVRISNNGTGSCD